MVQSSADCVVLVLMQVPTLNLRMPEARASGHSSEQLSAGGLAPEVTSGCHGRVWQQQLWCHVAPRGRLSPSWGSLALRASGVHCELGVPWEAQAFWSSTA